MQEEFDIIVIGSGLDTLAAAPDALPTLLPVLQERVGFVRRSWKMFSIMLLRASVSFCRAWVRCVTRASSSCASCSVRSNCSA